MTAKRHPKQHAPKLPPEQRELFKRGADDELSSRTKSSGHGKKTADKWNQ